MPLNRKAISLLLILVLTVSAVSIIFIYSYLPVFIEYKARQVLLQNTPFTRFKINVRHAGFYGIEVEDLEAGDKQNSTLSAGSINIRYSPTGLIQKRINGVDIEGLNLFLVVSDGQLSLPGLDAAAMKKNDEQGPAEIKIPIDLEELKVKKSNLHLTVDGEKVLFPFNLTLTKDNSGQPSHYEATLHIYPGPEQAGISADIDPAGNRALLRLTSESLELDKFAALISAYQGTKVTGRATIDAVSEIKLQPAEVVAAGIDITLQPFSLGLNNVRVESHKDSQNGHPLKLKMDYKNNKLQYSVDDIVLTAPAGVTFKTDGILEFVDDKMTGAGHFGMLIKDVSSVKLKTHIKVSGDVAYGYARSSGNWHFNMANSTASPLQKIKVQYQDVLIESVVPEYLVSGQGVAKKGDISFTAASPQITVLQNGINGNGRLALDGTLKFSGNDLQGQMQADFQNGRLEFTKNEYVIDGIVLSVNFPSLPQIKTDSGQELRFSKASFGNLSITDGRVAWQLESTGSLFIENSVFQWAGGSLNIDEMRLVPDEDQQFITIVCKRLDLIEVLQQLGITNAAGEGTVSGKVPLLLGKKSIDFEDGLLSSSPGEGGRIQIAAFELLTAGIPRDSPQFAQIDLAAEALKNFKYNWVKLFLHSTGEDLVMQLQMDGKPLQSLPFSYNSETGMFSRIEDGSQGIDQPVRLDVNFRFPLNRFLGYSGKIQDIMKKMQ